MESQSSRGTRRLELVDDPIYLNVFPGGHRGPTFHQRRKVVITAYCELESIQAMTEHEDAAVRFGENIGWLLHQTLQREGES